MGKVLVPKGLTSYRNYSSQFNISSVMVVFILKQRSSYGRNSVREQECGNHEVVRQRAIHYINIGKPPLMKEDHHEIKKLVKVKQFRSLFAEYPKRLFHSNQKSNTTDIQAFIQSRGLSCIYALLNMSVLENVIHSQQLLTIQNFDQT